MFGCKCIEKEANLKAFYCFKTFWKSHFLSLSHDCHLITRPGSLVYAVQGLIEVNSNIKLDKVDFMVSLVSSRVLME